MIQHGHIDAFDHRASALIKAAEQSPERTILKLLWLPFVEFPSPFGALKRWSCPVPPSRLAWNGYLKLSFVSCPIALYPATSAAERLSFRQVNRRTGHRVKHRLVDSVTGEEVAASDKARGYETAADEFLAGRGRRHQAGT